MFENIKSKIEKPLKEINIEVYEISYQKEKKENILRIVIDNDSIIDLDKCVEATKIINPIIDDIDPIKEEYTLEVTTREKGEKNE